MGHRALARLAWSLWALCVSLTALSLVLLVLNRSNPDAPVFDWWLGSALVVIDATVGAVIASRRPENPVGWLLCLSGVAVSISGFTSQYAIYALLARPGSLPAGEAMAWISAWLLPIMVGLQMSYILLFPTGRLPGRRWRWLARLIVAFVVVGVLSAAFSPEAHMGSLGPIRNPLGVEGFTVVYEIVLYAASPVLMVVAVSSLFLRLRRAGEVERQQIKWFAYGSAMFALGIILIVIPLATDTPSWFESTGEGVFTAAGVAVPVSIGIAILRYRLYDIDRIINRTLIYGALTVTLAVVYFGGIVSLQYAFRALTGSGSQLAVVASTLAIAALFNPLRGRIQSFVDRRFYRQKYDAQKTLEDFGARLRDASDLDGLEDDLVAVARETVQPAHVSLWLRAPDAGSRSTVEQRKDAL